MKVLIFLCVFAFTLQPRYVRTQETSECDPDFGTGILFNDCREVAKKMLVNAVEMRLESLYGLQTFSLGSKDVKTRLPQGMVYRSCAMGFDLDSDTDVSVQTSIHQIQAGFKQLVNECVGRQGQGGSLYASGLVFVITNPKQVSGNGTCLVSPDLERAGMPVKHRLDLKDSLKLSTQTPRNKRARTSLGQEAPAASCSHTHAAYRGCLQ